MSHRRKLVGGSDGYSIMHAEELDAEGNTIAFWFEVYGPDGEWLSSFPSMDAAIKCIVSQVEHASRPGPR